MNILILFLIILIFCERILKHLLIIRFFALPVPAEKTPIDLVSILQPILSGDPTLFTGLEKNLVTQTRYSLEFLWLVDEDDIEAQRICQTLIESHPEKHARIILIPPPGIYQNPKMVKLIQGAQLAHGDVLCVLDDDTRLPDCGLETCLPYLDLPDVGIAFGLPYYVSFGNFWSRLVAYFVNSHSLMSYVPYAMLTWPVTVSGMFYAIRREVLDQIGGFNGLENILADDFAIAQRMRYHGFRLAQTPLRHSISTWVGSSRGYLSLIQRWFIFPRESMLRHLKGREQIIFYALALLPVFFPWLALFISMLVPALWFVALVYFAYDYLIFAHLNLAYLSKAPPWTHSYWVPLLSILLPFQVLAALTAPQRIIWRGHVMQAEPGGGFKFIRRR